MGSLFVILTVITLSIFLVLAAICVFARFFRRDEAREQEINSMILARRDLLNKITEMQNKANTMQTDIEKEISSLPFQSKKAFAEKQTLLL